MTVGLSAADIIQTQRTEQGLHYEKLAKETRRLLRARVGEDVERAKRLNDSILHLKGVSPSQVHSNTFLANLSVQYKNDEYIGESLMPAVPVGKRSDAYAVFPKRERFAFPDDAIGARGRANELSESRSSDNYSVRDYALQNFVDVETVNNQDAPFDEMMDLIEAINDGLAFKREKRIATIVTTAGNYAGNTVTLAGSDQWNSAGGGDPIKNVQDALAAMWMGQGRTRRVMFSSLEVYNVLARHVVLRDLFKYTTEGLATRQQLARYFDCDDYLIGAAREDTANAGAAASYSRIWGKHLGILRVAERATRRSAHFGSTFRSAGDPVTNEWFDAAVGKAGGYLAKVGVSEDHKVVAGDTGYLIVNAIA